MRKALALGLLGAAAVAVTTGCANYAPFGTKPAAQEDPSAYCFRSLSRDPRLSVLASKIGAVENPDSATVAQMTSGERPNAAEKDALTLWGAERQRCFEAGRKYRAAATSPGYQLALERLHLQYVNNIAQLYAGTIGYGQFIQERKRIALDATARSVGPQGQVLSPTDTWPLMEP